jgi:D-tyrosyl-tRNA(Tyr) deacylase
MRAVVQRVSGARVEINGAVKGEIGPGLVVLFGVEPADTAEDIEWLAGKIVRLRVFDDESGVMNRSVQDIKGGILAITQFTLFASTKKGNRPSYSGAAAPEIAAPLCDQFLARLEQELRAPVQRGEFGAHMIITLANDGPVTILYDTQRRE